MKNHPVDGIVLAPVSSRAKHLGTAALGSIPVVTIDRPLDGAAIDSVEVENRKGSHMAVEHLRSHRYERIACIATDFHLRSIRLRVSAYEERMRSEKLPVTTVIIDPGKEVLPALRTLFRARRKPDALFVTNNVCTTHVIQALQTMGLRIPQDVALVGFDDVDFYSLLSPSITAIRQPVAEIGAAAAQLLLDRIRNEGPSAPVGVTLPVELVVRESCGCSPTRHREHQ